MYGYKDTEGGDCMKDRTWLRIARCLPKRLRYWCAIDVIAYGTTGKYGKTVVPDLSAMDALKRYEDVL
jgi:hypothetical protein